MSELRSAVRTLAYDRPASPARTLKRVDSVRDGLGFDTLATVLLARVEAADGPARRLRWSSAGHPPPLLLDADGRVRVLHAPPERLLGMREPAARSDHEVDLHPGDTVLLYTDGLLEHGHAEIDVGLTRLTAGLAALAGHPLEQLCDALLDRLLPGRADDDVALLAARCTRRTR
jgi:serine phosphatase RsbU (regulator of sigma subunit)